MKMLSASQIFQAKTLNRRGPPQDLLKRTNKYVPKKEPEVGSFLHKRQAFGISVASTTSKSKQQLHR